MQGAATVDDRPTTSGDDDDRIVMVKLLIALASLEPNDKNLNVLMIIMVMRPRTKLKKYQSNSLSLAPDTIENLC